MIKKNYVHVHICDFTIVHEIAQRENIKFCVKLIVYVEDHHWWWDLDITWITVEKPLCHRRSVVQLWTCPTPRPPPLVQSIWSAEFATLCPTCVRIRAWAIKGWPACIAQALIRTGSNLLVNWGLSIWSLHALPAGAPVSSQNPKTCTLS